jgi:dipeptidyl aminopeptidase/acylaminoacyl peptidase
MRLFAQVLAAFCLMAWGGLAHAQSSLPVEAFGRLPAIADAAISPDGTKVAIAQFNDGVAAVVVIDIDRRERVYAGQIPDADTQLRGVGWADNERVTFLASITVMPNRALPAGIVFQGAVRRLNYFRTGVINITTREMNYMITNPERPWADFGSPVVAPIEGDDGYGRMYGYGPGGTRRVFRANLDTGDVREFDVIGANRDTIFYVLDERGDAVIRADSEERSNRWRIFTYDGDQPRLLMEDVSEDGRPIPVVGLFPDDRLGVIGLDATREREQLRAINRQTGASEVLYEREVRGDLDGAVRDPWTRRIVGVQWTDERVQQRFFDADLQRIADAIAPLFAGEAIIDSWSRDRRRFLVYGEQGLGGGGYYVYDATRNTLLDVGRRYPELAANEAAVASARNSITFRARDGVRIPAYLTLPPGDAEARNLPLVLLVHGGPGNGSRDTLAFDWWAAFLASRGYAVLQPNFRGSGGYGRVWEEAGWRQWGGLMQTDVEDGVAALVRAGIADPARVCIVGASYGGYAALAGATITPDRYRCAVSIAGVSDPEAMLDSVTNLTGTRSSVTDYWRLSIGEDRDAIRAISPINLVDRVRIPILLMHGTDDTVVPIQQSRMIERRLQSAGKEVQFIELTGDDHWLSDQATRVQMLRELERFLAQHLRPVAVEVGPEEIPGNSP